MQGLDKKDVFQFLIGRLVTKDIRGRDGLIIRFQFLIGRLVTRRWRKLGRSNSGVSIPHR